MSINAELEKSFSEFMEFPSGSNFVTSTSAQLFAQHWAELHAAELRAENKLLKNQLKQCQLDELKSPS